MLKASKDPSVKLTEEDREAIHEIKKFRKATDDDRTRINDILVDALWHFLKHTTGKTREQIRAVLPPTLLTEIQLPPQNNVRQMPTTKKKR